MKIESFSLGNKYYPNEDRLSILELGKYGAVAVLADGMGGLSLGDIAAEVVVETASSYIENNHQETDKQALLHKALDFADNELRNVSIANKSKMGAAIAVAIIIEQHLFCSWLGNVRIYIMHNNQLSLITIDHVANIGYGNSALTRCIKGAGLRDDIPFADYKLAEGDEIFICSDGLYNIAEEEFSKSSIEKIKTDIGLPEDDASLIKVII